MTATNYATGAEIKTYLLQHKDQIFSEWDAETTEIYLFLRDELRKGPILDNTLFKFIFRSFYHMDNRSVTEAFDQRFFSIMDKQLASPNLPNLTTITYDLYQVKNKNNNPSMQFPLVTNMANTIHPNFPTYTPEVAKLFTFTSTKHLSGFYKKMKRFIEQYRYLHRTYVQLALDPDIQVLLNQIDVDLPLFKKVDSLVFEASKLAN
ncbi:hypothetical protein [Aquibacillus sediminis]|uniref:hypothetical protein n=1 Tax=Aquibacillus sediminis TaxID=2574734 RepID=UPI001107CD74|nr:hypothetical protein [Aquibacillus sediminis]